MLFADLEAFFAVVGEVLNIMTFGAGDAQLTGNGDHFFADVFFFFNEFRYGLGRGD